MHTCRKIKQPPCSAERKADFSTLQLFHEGTLGGSISAKQSLMFSRQAYKALKKLFLALINNYKPILLIAIAMTYLCFRSKIY